MLKDYDNWCPEIYRGLFIRPVGKDIVTIAPCCQSIGKSTSTADFKFESNQYFNDLRKQNKPDACHRCWEIEEHGGHSKRHAAIEFYKIKPSTDVELNALEYNVNWACNLACVMCGPEFSSSWAKELNIRDNYDKITQIQNQILKDLDKTKLTRVHFNGGEPLINDEHAKLLEQIDSLNQCKVTYNTNGTMLPSQRTLDAWEKSKMVRLFFSIDAIEDAFEYIRWPGRWEKIQQNIEWYIKNSPSNVMFGLNVTVGAYNLFELIELHDWYLNTISQNREGDPSDFNCQIAYNYDPGWVKDDIKKDVIDALSSREIFAPIVSYLKNAQIKQSDQWIEKLKEIDQRRKLDWKQVLKIGKYYQ